MLQAIRSRAGGILVKILFGLLIISFGFWGIYTRSDYYQGHSPETVIATVGEQNIRAEELQRALEPAMERLRTQFGTFNQEQAKQLGVLDNLLAQLIDRDLLDQEAARLRLETSDDVIRNAIYDNPAFKGPDGRFDRAMFNQLLVMNRVTEDQLVARLRRELPRTDMLKAITAGIIPPRPVIEALYRYRGEKRLADIVAFPVAAAADPGQPSEADLGKFYDGHPDLFRAPEFRGFTVATLAPADIVKPGDIPEDKVRKEYEQRKDEFETPDRREIQQILAPSEEKAKEAEAALAAGKDWKDVATTIAGQDPETVELGLLSRQEIPHELGDVAFEMPHELADIAFELPLNRASEPVKSPLGWHILRVVKIEPAATQSFDQVKPQIAAELKRQRAADRLDKIGNQADDALAGGGALADVAAKFQLKAATVAASDDGGSDPAGKAVALPVAADEVLKAVFATNQGDTSRIMDMKDGSIFAVHVDKITPPQVRPLAEVKGQAVGAWQAEQKREAATKQAETLAGAVNPGLALAKAAGDKKLTLLPAAPLSRSAAPGQTVPPALVAKLFDAKPGDVVTASDDTGAYTAQLKEIQSPETVSDEAAAGLSDQLANEAKVGVAGEFTEALRHRFPVEIQRDALDRMF